MSMGGWVRGARSWRRRNSARCCRMPKKQSANYRFHVYVFVWWVLQHCTGFARLVWGRLRVHPSFHLFKSICVFCVFLLSSCPFLDILQKAKRKLQVSCVRICVGTYMYICVYIYMLQNAELAKRKLQVSCVRILLMGTAALYRVCSTGLR